MGDCYRYQGYCKMALRKMQQLQM